MRVRVLSDLHREFGHVPLPEVVADVVVLAGDIDRGVRGITWARMAFPGVPVLYVAGNHESYGVWIFWDERKRKSGVSGRFW